MSGNFVQRGEPAIIDKWNRTKMALESGVDLVLELPTIFSVSSAEFFSHGAITILHKLGIVSSLCFGSECGDIDALKYISEILVEEPQDYKNLLQTFLSTGITYPAARSKALQEYTSNFTSKYNIAEVLNSSNNILGIEYCKSLLRNNSSIEPYTIQRLGGAYNSKSLNEIFSSATAIRELIKKHRNISFLESELPPGSFSIINRIFDNYSFPFPQDMYVYLKYKLMQNPGAISKLPDIEAGLDNRICSAILNSSSYDDFIDKIKTKRYTYTRICRCLCQLFIGFELFHTEKMRRTSPEYVRVLGFTKKGSEILKLSKDKRSIDVLTKLPSKRNSMLDLDIQSTKMYSLINTSISPESDFKISPIIHS